MNTKTINTNLPAIAGEGSLSGYLTRIKKFPMLSSEEEYMLAKSWRDRGDLKSAQKLVTSHLRLVAKIAMGYRGYGLPVSELVSEGNIGLMQAVKKFDPEKGFKLATYAMWWIRASIQEYILRSWSLVKIGTTTAQKKLFFNLKKLKNKLSARNIGDLHPEHVDEIAKACVYFMKKKTRHTLINIGTGKDYSIKYYANLILKLIMPNKKIVIKYDKSKPNGTLRKVLDVSLSKKYGWHYSMNLKSAIIKTYNSYLKEIN